MEFKIRMLRPLSVLGPRFTQILSWFFGPTDIAEPFVPKQKQKEILQTVQTKASSYVPPPFRPAEPPKKLS